MKLISMIMIVLIIGSGIAVPKENIYKETTEITFSYNREKLSKREMRRKSWKK